MVPVPLVPLDDATFGKDWASGYEVEALSESYLEAFDRDGRGRPTKIDSIRGPQLSLFIWSYHNVGESDIYTSDTILIMLTVFGQPNLPPIHLRIPRYIVIPEGHIWSPAGQVDLLLEHDDFLLGETVSACIDNHGKLFGDSKFYGE